MMEHSERYKKAFEILSAAYPGTTGLRVVNVNISETNPTQYYASDNKGNVVIFIDVVCAVGYQIIMSHYKLDCNGNSVAIGQINFPGSDVLNVWNDVMLVVCYLAIANTIPTGSGVTLTVFEAVK